MQKPPDEAAVLASLMRWAEAHDAVRAVILTSSRAIPNAPLDMLSDYDVILAVRSVEPFYEERAWLGDFGPVLLVYSDPLRPYFGFPTTCIVTQYDNGLKIDFSVCPVEALRAVVSAPQLPEEFDAGYRVLLDKDGLTAGLRPATYGGTPLSWSRRGSLRSGNPNADHAAVARLLIDAGAPVDLQMADLDASDTFQAVIADALVDR